MFSFSSSSLFFVLAICDGKATSPELRRSLNENFFEFIEQNELAQPNLRKSFDLLFIPSSESVISRSRSFKSLGKYRFPNLKKLSARFLINISSSSSALYGMSSNDSSKSDFDEKICFSDSGLNRDDEDLFPKRRKLLGLDLRKIKCTTL